MVFDVMLKYMPETNHSTDSPVIINLSQMVREGKSRDCVEWPPALQRTNKSKLAEVRCRNSDSEPEPDGYVPAPIFSHSFSDAIALALEKAVVNKEILKGKLSAVRFVPLSDVTRDRLCLGM